MRMKQVLKKTLTAGMLALMACTSMSAMAEKKLVYVGPATAIHDYGPNVTGDMDTICHDVVEMYYDVYVNKMYHLGLQTHPSEFVDAKFAWFSGGHDGDTSRGLACYGKGRSYGWKGGVLMLLPEHPVYGDTPASSFANVTCNYPDYPNVGLYNGTLKIDTEGQRVGEYKLGCYAWQEVEPCSGIAEDGTAYPPNCFHENVPRCGTIDKGEGDYGLVLCPSNDVCVYNHPDVNNEEAQHYARECIYVHEFQHVENQKEYGQLCVDGDRDGGYYPDLYMNEYIAYNAEFKCLEQKVDNCSTVACKLDIVAAMRNAVNKMIENSNNFSDWHN